MCLVEILQYRRSTWPRQRAGERSLLVDAVLRWCIIYDLSLVNTHTHCTVLSNLWLCVLPVDTPCDKREIVRGCGGVHNKTTTLLPSSSNTNCLATTLPPLSHNLSDSVNKCVVQCCNKISFSFSFCSIYERNCQNRSTQVAHWPRKKIPSLSLWNQLAKQF